MLKTESQRWTVKFTRKANDQFSKLQRNGSKPPISNTILLLTGEMEREGPYRKNWPNYGPLAGNDFHCHLKKGRPTYVACWRVLDREKKIIEVYYVGTHENAPY